MSDDTKPNGSPSQGEGSIDPPLQDSPGAGAPSSPPNPPAEDPAARLTELDNLLRERDKAISDLQLTLASVTASAEKSAGDVKERELALANTLKALKQSILQAHPDIPDELLTGQNVDELLESLSKASALVAKIRSQIPVLVGPAGAPTRSGPDLSGMSPREKIIHGLRK